jgi:integrase
MAYKTNSPVESKSLTFSAPAAFHEINLQRGQERNIPMKYVTYRPATLKMPKSGKWFIEFYVRHPHTGEFQRFKKYGLGEGGGLNRITNLEEKQSTGQEWVACWNLALEKGWIPPEFKEQPFEVVRTWNFLQAINLFKINLEAKAQRKKTWQAYLTCFNHFFGSFPKLNSPLSSITRADIENFLLRIKVENDHRNTTYNNYLRYTKTFFNFCVDMGYVEQSPIRKSKWLKEEIKSHRYFSDDQWNKIREKASAELLDFIEFLYNTGTRPTDARLAKWKQLLSDRFRVNAETTKTDKDRFVPLSVTYAAKLNAQKRDPEEYIFGGKHPKGINHYGYQFTKLRRSLKFEEGYTLYGVKHTRIVHLALQGADPYDIMNFIGHTSLETTMKYLRNLGLAINRRVVDTYKEF